MLVRPAAALVAFASLGLSVSAAGQMPELVPDFQVNTYTTNWQHRVSVASRPSGDFVVVWESVGPDGDIGIAGRLFDAKGAPRGDEFVVNSHTTGFQFFPVVAMDANGGFAVAWEGYDASGLGIFGRRFNGAGTPIGSEFAINTHMTAAQQRPAIAMNPSGEFLVVWQSQAQDGAFEGVFGQRYDGSGLAEGLEFQVNAYTTANQQFARASMDDDGSFVVAWVNYSQDVSTYGIYARKYDAAGVPLSDEVRADAMGPNVYFPDVAMDSQGGFLVVWSGPGDGAAVGIEARRFDPTGTPVGVQFPVNSYTTGPQYWPHVASNAAGEFVVAWESYGQDDPAAPFLTGVYARQLDASGNPSSAEFLVNTYTTGNQLVPAVALDGRGAFVVAWSTWDLDGDQYGVFARRGGGLSETGLHVDERVSGGTSNVNGVLEEGERVTIDPSWRNAGAPSRTLPGLIAEFTGPPGLSYVIEDGTASYGTLGPGAAADCFDVSGDCYEVSLAGARSPGHTDAELVEEIAPGALQIWNLHVGGSFADTPATNAFFPFVENLFHNGVTGGCGGDDYCPTSSVTRAQMAVFLLKAQHGSNFVPPPCGGVFGDVACPSAFADWIEQLAAEGITGGCGAGNYCPENPVTRQQMAVFLLKARHGSSFVPPACIGLFDDVACPSPFADWIEELASESITAGCSSSPPLYCPVNPNNRGQMAAFLVKTFELALYGP